MLGQKGERLFQVALALVALLDRADPEGAFLRIGGGHGADHGQGELPFPEIVTDILARISADPAVIQQVIDDLEGNAERVTICEERFHMLFRRAGQHATNLCRGGEEGGGLAAHDLRIDLLRRGEVLGGGQLQNLTFRDGRGGVGQDVEHPQAARFNHQLEGARK